VEKKKKKKKNVTKTKQVGKRRLVFFFVFFFLCVFVCVGARARSSSSSSSCSSVGRLRRVMGTLAGVVTNFRLRNPTRAEPVRRTRNPVLRAPPSLCITPVADDLLNNPLRPVLSLNHALNSERNFQENMKLQCEKFKF
jgi:hypothetical protein